MRDVRIQKVLAEQGICSRRAAEQLIREGRVKLNGRPVTVGDKMDTLKDLLTVDGQKVYVPKKSEKYYYMMYKPRGYITTTNDERGRKTVLSAWRDRKQEEITHPYLGEKIQVGLIAYVQAMMLARVLRGDLDCYPPFVWR